MGCCSLKGALTTVYSALMLAEKNVSIVSFEYPFYDPAYEEKPEPLETTIVDLGQAAEVKNLSEMKIFNSAGMFSQGDRVFNFSAEKITREILENKDNYIKYGDDLLTILRVYDDTILGEVVEWKVIAGKRVKQE